MPFMPFADLPGGFSTNDGTIDFYLRVRSVLRPDMVVLDLGAGRAQWFEDDQIDVRKDARLLKGRAAKVIAVDVDDAVLSNRSADEAMIMEEGKIPLEDASVDLIVSDWVLEQIDDPAAFFGEFDTVLRPGGYVCGRTPHKWSYLSLVARIVSNRAHVGILRSVQPGRKEIDVFPTRYRLNTMAALRRVFAGYQNQSFVHRPDPAYFFGNRILYKLMTAAHRTLPAATVGVLQVFLRKPS